MKLKDLKELLKFAPDDAEIKVENSEIVINESKPIEHKYKVGDRVLCKDGAKYKITGLSEVDGMPGYSMLGFDHLVFSEAAVIELVQQDITERIKTFDDAKRWCNDNGRKNLVVQYQMLPYHDASLLAYFKLRIITAALNEGWEPSFTENEQQWAVVYSFLDNQLQFYPFTCFMPSSADLLFKSKKLAEYSANKFYDIYIDFCKVKKEAKS